jgi:glucose/arabinose dehydrogenase
VTLRPVLRASLGARSRSVTLRAADRRRWSAPLTLPAAGRWRLSVRVGAWALALGSLTVRETSIDIADPVKLALEPSGTLLVADVGASRIVRIDPRTGTAGVVAGPLTRVASVTAGPDGAIYALADERLYRIEGDRANELGRFAEEGPTDVTVTSSGAIYLARYGDHVDVFADGAARPLARGFDRPHGITAAPDGSLLVADTYAGAVRRVAPDGTVTTLATGLSRPLDVALDADGTLLVAELDSGELSRISADGTVTVVTSRLAGPSGVVVAPDGAIYVSDPNGAIKVGRVDRTTGAVTPVAR